MAENQYYIGVDIGTTSTKAVLYGDRAEVLSSHHLTYPLHSPHPTIAEQDPDEIFHAVFHTIHQVIKMGNIDPKKVAFVSFSAAMHSLIAVDGHGRPLTRSITWADTRAKAWAEKIKTEWNGMEIYRRTGTPIHPMSPLAKLIWLRNAHPEIFTKASKFIGIKEYVFFRLFGEYVCDHSLASATGLFNLERKSWDEEALSITGIDEDRLPTLVSPTYILTGLKEEFAHPLGLSVETPFVIGASDGVLSNLGVNAIHQGDVAITIGTSGAIRTITTRPQTDPAGRTFCYMLADEMWVIGGPVNNGGGTLRWVRDEFFQDEGEQASSYERLTALAETVTSGSDGLLFLPYLAGERAPLWNAHAKGVFFGLGLHHNKAHLVRSVMEGVILNLYLVMQAMEEVIGQPNKIQATGGFAHSPLWRQILADIFNTEVHVPDHIESSCLGAVILGLKAIGAIRDFQIVNDWVGTTHVHKPLSKNVAIYKELIPIFSRLSEKLQDDFTAISQFQQKWMK